MINEGFKKIRKMIYEYEEKYLPDEVLDRTLDEHMKDFKEANDIIDIGKEVPFEIIQLTDERNKVITENVVLYYRNQLNRTLYQKALLLALYGNYNEANSILRSTYDITLQCIFYNHIYKEIIIHEKNEVRGLSDRFKIENKYTPVMKIIEKLVENRGILEIIQSFVEEKIILNREINKEELTIPLQIIKEIENFFKEIGLSSLPTDQYSKDIFHQLLNWKLFEPLRNKHKIKKYLEYGDLCGNIHGKIRLMTFYKILSQGDVPSSVPNKYFKDEFQNFFRRLRNMIDLNTLIGINESKIQLDHDDKKCLMDYVRNRPNLKYTYQVLCHE